MEKEEEPRLIRVQHGSSSVIIVNGSHGNAFIMVKYSNLHNYCERHKVPIIFVTFPEIQNILAGARGPHSHADRK